MERGAYSVERQAGWDYATLEWIWDEESLRVNFPNGDEVKTPGGYNSVVATLSSLGRQGWEVATCVATANWLFWTLKRRV